MTAASWPPGPAQAWRERPYHQLLRGPRHRWWRPLLSLAVVLGLFVVLLVASTVALLLATVASGVTWDEVLVGDALLDETVLASPPVMLVNNLVLAALVPVSVLAVWAGHGWRPRWVSSVVGGLRWRWMLECAVLAAVVLLMSFLIFVALDGWPRGRGQDVLLLLAIVLLTTPLQAAGEEWFFRGWMTQTIGSVLARPVVGVVVAGAVSATLFAFAHGAQNVWLWLHRFAFGVLTSYLVWRTGGLEAATAVHAVNNLVAWVPVILTGTLEDSLLVSDVPLEVVAVDVAAMVVMGVLITWWARRRSVQRWHVPPPAPPPPLAWQPPAPPTAAGPPGAAGPAGFGPAPTLR
ncbi:lysostaphin resistance A-like protein [Thalassiella azotivora]